MKRGFFENATHALILFSGCISGLAISPFDLRNVIGVVKSYTTRVGGGPFPTEQFGDVGKALQELGGEVGVSTGRQRRCGKRRPHSCFNITIAELKAGHLDLVVLKYSAAVNYYTTINLTKLDVLDTFTVVRVAVAYHTSTGERLTTFPADLSLLDKCTVEYVDFQGWQSSTKGLRTWSELPLQAQRYIEFIESSIGVKIGYVGTGPNREDMIIRG